jgi:hypothetical protein
MVPVGMSRKSEGSGSRNLQRHCSQPRRNPRLWARERRDPVCRRDGVAGGHHRCRRQRGGCRANGRGGCDLEDGAREARGALVVEAMQIADDGSKDTYLDSEGR